MTTLSMITIVIPTRNEAKTLGVVLERACAAPDVDVVVVDGGSTDGTTEVAAGQPATHLLQCAPGRGAQMNHGAREARGEILLFLHADTLLPVGYEATVRRSLAQPGVVGGAFRLRIDSSRTAFRWIETVANFRAGTLQFPYGDQALFMRASTFEELGGFPELPLMEDFELVRRLRRLGRIRLADEAATTSSRRWDDLGVWRTTAINQIAVSAYLAGIAPERIAGWYYRR